MNPKIDFINEKKIFKRKTDINYSISKQKLLEDQLNKNKVYLIRDIDDLIKIKHITNYHFTDKILRMGYWNKNLYLLKENDKIKIKTVFGIRSVKKFETTIGLIVTDNQDESGGQLYNITEYGAEQVGSGNFTGIFEYKGKLYAIDTFNHLYMCRCRLHEIRKHEDFFEDIILFESYDLTFGAYYIEDNYLYFYSDSCNNIGGLYKFNLDNDELTLIEEDLYGGLSVESLIKSNDYIYLLGFYNLGKYDLNTRKMEVYTTFNNEEFEIIFDGDKD
ncbi:MAG: hypothetical protein IKV87_06230, partial [Methanobrevibacter sp.]|nr:hypothetical protein [Methanobrevibacter sp.]